MKTLDMADKYAPLSYEDEDTTVRVQVPTFHDQVVIKGENADFDLHGERDTIPCPPPYPQPFEEKRYPGVGIALCLVTGLAFWGTLAWLIWR